MYMIWITHHALNMVDHHESENKELYSTMDSNYTHVRSEDVHAEVKYIV